jgi:hypothetical protein
MIIKDLKNYVVDDEINTNPVPLDTTFTDKSGSNKKGKD